MAFSVFRAGEETRVNATTFDSQMHPKTTALPDGWLVTWSSEGQDGSGSGIYMQKYNLQGEPQFLNNGVPVDRLVNTGSPTGDQIWSTATALAGNAGFVVTWIELSADGSQANAFQQRFTLSGGPQGVAQKVNGNLAILTEQHLDIVALPDGGWRTTWSAFDGNGYGIYQQRFNSTGAPQSGADGERVNTFTTGHQTYATVTMLKDDPADPNDGGWVVTWVSNPDPMGTAGADIFMRRYRANGTADPEVRVNTTTDKNQTLPQVTALPDGGWLVVWQSTDQDGSGTGIFMQRYWANGTANGSERRVNLTTEGAQGNPKVQVLADGGWIVTWESQNDVFQRYFAHDGSTAGPDLLIADPFSSSVWNRNASIEALPNGWVVAWQTQNQDHQTTGAGIAQRIFTQSGEQVLTTALEYAFGTGGNETLQVRAGGLSEGDIVDGGDGNDTLQMIEAGELNLYANLKGFETLLGSDGNDTIVSDAAHLIPFKTIDGGGGDDDELRLFNGGEIYDLQGKTIAGIERIVLADFGAKVLVSDADTALLVFGEGSDDEVELDGGTFTLDQRLQLFRQGIETVTDDGGSRTNAAPVVSNLNGDQVEGLAGGSVRLDAGGNIEVTEDHERFETLIVSITNRVKSQDRLGIALGDGITIVDDEIRIGGEAIGTLDENGTGDAGLKVDFFNTTTAEQVERLIQALTYVNAGTGAVSTKTRDVAITLIDGGSAQTTVGVSVDVLIPGGGTGGNRAPALVGLSNDPVRVADTGFLSPFARLRVDDDGIDVTVQVTFDSAKGTLIVPADSLGEYNPQTGTYTVKGHPIDVTIALRALQFDPTDKTGPLGAIDPMTFTINVTDSGGLPATHVLNVEVVTADRPPSQPILDGTSVDELALTGQIVGRIGSTDPNGEGVRYSLVGAEAAPFEVVGSELRVKSGVALDYEQTKAYTFTIRATAGGLSNDRVVTIQVNDKDPENTAGSAANDKFVGGAGRDTLSGAAGDDTLSGALGNDTLKGEAGKDIFVFSTRANTKTNKDKLVDFSVKDDAIWLDNAAFIKLGTKGTEDNPTQLSKSFFTIGSKAKDKNDYIVYDSKKGVLYYDADGSGKGKAVEIATLSKNLKMTNKDFFII